MDDLNYEKLCGTVCRIAKDAGDFIRKESKSFNRSSIEYKGFNDLVSYVDKTAEKIIVSALTPLIEGAGFITEENTGQKKDSEYQWVIDPLDGTTNFVHGLPCYCVSIALMKKDTIVTGVVYEINFDECFYAWEGGPALMNEKIIRVSSTAGLNKALIATGFPYTNFKRMKPYMEVFDHCMRNTHGLRRVGSAAADLVYVACGRLDAFYEYGLNSWDVAGGAFIVSRAGGMLSDFSGGENFIFGGEIVAANIPVFQDFLPVIKSKFYPA
jgi:myo-inositol-1(or 4)-monophosphatase